MVCRVVVLGQACERVRWPEPAANNNSRFVSQVWKASGEGGCAMINSSIKLDICVWYIFIFASNVCISVAETKNITYTRTAATYGTDRNESHE